MHVVIAHIPSYVIHDLKPRGRFLMCIFELKKKGFEWTLVREWWLEKTKFEFFQLSLYFLRFGSCKSEL